MLFCSSDVGCKLFNCKWISREHNGAGNGGFTVVSDDDRSG